MERFQPVGGKPRSNLVLVIELTVLIVVCIAIVAALYFYGYLTVNKRAVITYEVTASNGHARISYTQLNGGMSELETVTTPWTKTIIFNEWLDLYLIAGNPSNTGDITCTLKVDKRVLDQQKADYPDDKVACRGILP